MWFIYILGFLFVSTVLIGLLYSIFSMAITIIIDDLVFEPVTTILKLVFVIAFVAVVIIKINN